MLAVIRSFDVCLLLNIIRPRSGPSGKNIQLHKIYYGANECVFCDIAFGVRMTEVEDCEHRPS